MNLVFLLSLGSLDRQGSTENFCGLFKKLNVELNVEDKWKKIIQFLKKVMN